MTQAARPTSVTVIPTLRYRDAAAAIDWLCKAFGFEKHLVVPGENGAIAHAELVFGNGMIMVGSAANGGAFDRLQQPPKSPGDVVNQSPYIVVEDIDSHYERAIAAGAKIALPLTDQDYGGRDYSCHDPEGHLWNLGTYDPWKAA
ncbi:VOC family protein [Nodosilinea nodulosa]|uniref:VOC family protein n=1 Tax=Nodosilinea nodulosa TaxID=416001 RepID=UPI00031A05CE|nr:VOC family protein [Nodosilinea nodulosa]